MKTTIIEPNFQTNINGFVYKGRGPNATGNNSSWNRKNELYFVCANCGSMMHSKTNSYFTCECGAMHYDLDAFRFGSKYGDENILVYEKN